VNCQLDKYAQDASQQQAQKQAQNFAVNYVAGQVKHKQGDVVPVQIAPMHKGYDCSRDEMSNYSGWNGG